MTFDDPTPPVSDDDFPEFAEPPRSAPGPGSSARAPRPADETDDAAQAAADAVMERLRRKREEGSS